MVVKTTTKKPCFGSWWECVTTTKKPWNWWGRNDLENDLDRNALEKTLINDETVESMAFEICNTDGVDGLSWAEVEQFELSNYCLNMYSRTWL